MQIFREALTILQRQVDELDELKAAHYQEIIEHEEEVWDVVQGKVSPAALLSINPINIPLDLHSRTLYNGRFRQGYGKSVCAFIDDVELCILNQNL